MGEFNGIERANINFFGNWVGIDMQLDELKVYLEEVRNFIEKKNFDPQADMITGLDHNRLENLKYHFEYTQGDILRNSIIISLIILLEAEIDQYCQDFRKHKKIPISYRDFRGDILEKLKFFSTKVLTSDFDFASRCSQDVIGLYEVRNSLIHNSGLVSDFGKRKTIESFVQRNQAFSIDENERIHISHDGCLDSIVMIETFFEKITRFAFTVFPKGNGYEGSHVQNKSNMQLKDCSAAKTTVGKRSVKLRHVLAVKDPASIRSHQLSGSMSRCHAKKCPTPVQDTVI